MTVSGARIPRAERRAQTRTQLLDAAGRVFAAGGYHGATLDDVAAAAGLTKGAVYYNFSSKEDLFLALLQDRLEQRLRDVRETVEHEPSRADRGRGREAARAFLDRLERDPRWMPLFFEFVAFAARNTKVRRAVGSRFFRTARATLTDVIERILDDADVTPSIPPQHLAIAVDALANGLALERLFTPDEVPDTLLGDVLELLFRALSDGRTQQKEDEMSNQQAQAFVDRFQELWEDPDPDRYAELWHDDGLLRHPTMKDALPQDGIPDYVRRLKGFAPDISLAVEHWAASGETVMIEWTLTATVGDEGVEIQGVDRFTLRGDRATDGVAYFDTMPLWARVDPSLEQDESLEDRVQALMADAADS
jgi:AcrR family transcriptional regulator